MESNAITLDERYLKFRERTSGAFEATPELEVLRYRLFKEILVGRRGHGLDESAKHWLRPLFMRRRNGRAPGRADVVIWVEGARAILSEILMPVCFELGRRGVLVQVLSHGRPKWVPDSAIEVTCGARVRPPSWARRAWEAVRIQESDLDRVSLRRAFMHAAAMTQPLLEELERLLKCIRPRLVLNAVSLMSGGAALVTAARRLGVQSVQLQHGLTQVLYTPVLDDVMITWGEASSENLIRLGVPGRKLIALGSPRHDRMVPRDRAVARKSLLQSLGLPDRPTFVFFSNGNDLVRNGTAPAGCAEWLGSLTRDNSTGWNIVVRLHPNEDGSLYSSHPRLTVVKGTPDLETTLEGCDAIGSLCSTVLYEGLLYGRPILQFHADGWPELADNWRQGLARRIASSEQLETALMSMQSEPASATECDVRRQRVFANHPHATVRIADWVEQRCHSA